MPTDTSELGLERLIVRHLAGISEHPTAPTGAIADRPRPDAASA